MGRCFTSFLLSFAVLTLAGSAQGQTTVHMDLSQAIRLLDNHDLGAAAAMLTRLSNNYRQFANVRVQSRTHKQSLATLAQALRRDFDGSGTDYIPDHTIWVIRGEAGHTVVLAASILDPKTVLLSVDLDYLKGMLAWEIYSSLRQGTISIRQAQIRSLAIGIEMQVLETDDDPIISFFGHRGKTQIVGKLMMFEPLDFAWE